MWPNLDLHFVLCTLDALLSHSQTMDGRNDAPTESSSDESDHEHEEEEEEEEEDEASSEEEEEPRPSWTMPNLLTDYRYTIQAADNLVAMTTVVSFVAWLYLLIVWLLHCTIGYTIGMLDGKMVWTVVIVQHANTLMQGLAMLSHLLIANDDPISYRVIVLLFVYANAILYKVTVAKYDH
jgi:hypothetical protein